MMYQFDFVQASEDDERVISVMAENYDAAIRKVRSLGLPGFDLTEWGLEGVYEQGAVALTRNN
jgi:hypothetical protein